ncbi:MAG: hypothetical protein WC755_00270 [Candidatus Woesearchaeota archaeon]|jgi:hypothetical protein
MSFFEKRGSSQVDWIVSLALFLLFLVFTFVVVSPHQKVFVDEKAALTNIKYSFMNDYTQNVDSLPIFIDSKRTGLEPIIVSLDYPFSNLRLDDNRNFYYYDNELIFMEDISKNQTKIKIISSDLNQTSHRDEINSKQLRVQNSNVYVDTKQFLANYKNGNLDTITYLNKQRVANFSIYTSDGQKSLMLDTKLINQSVAVVSTQKNNFMTHKEYMFADTSRMYLYTNSQTPYYLKFNLKNYNEFFIYPASNGTFSYNTTSCMNFTADVFEVSDSSTILTFVMESSPISLCMNTFDLEMTIHNPKHLEMIFSNNPLGSQYVKKDRIDAYTGIITTKSGVSIDRLSNITKKTPNQIRAEYSIPNGMNFQLLMTDINYSEKYKYSFAEPQKTSNVFIKRWNEYLIQNNGTTEIVTMGVKVWQ